MDGLILSVPSFSEVERDAPAQLDRHMAPCYVYESQRLSNGTCIERRALPPTLSPAGQVRNVRQPNRPTSQECCKGNVPTRENIAALIRPTYIIDMVPDEEMRKELEGMNGLCHQSLAGLLPIRREPL
jgi:hypothetical protein